MAFNTLKTYLGLFIEILFIFITFGFMKNNFN